MKNSEVIKATNLILSPKFKYSNVYKEDGTKIHSICTACADFYEVDEQLNVYAICDDEVESQNSQASVDNIQHNKVNPWGPENLFSLNINNENEFKTFMMSLSRIEIMCISPLLINIVIMRCPGSGVPSSRHGTIAYPMQTPMQANPLPWYDFKNLPFIIVYRKEKNHMG